MKKILFVLFLFNYLVGFAQDTDTSIIHFEGNQFYHISNHQNSKVLIFLHGGVNNPAFDSAEKSPDLDFLLEGNKLFTSSSMKHGFDLIIPITNEKLNWLTNYEFCFETLKKLLESRTSYTSRYISGFSDGGTGSFKIFYNHHDYFNGLAIFNGYPQHSNFYQTVNYAEVNEKPIAFFSTFEDKVIPYEFLLTEYCKQKAHNPNTFLYVRDGQHSFDMYTQKDVDLSFDILNSNITNNKHITTHGFIKDDTLIEFYTYRKKICKQFGYGKEFWEENRNQAKSYK